MNVQKIQSDSKTFGTKVIINPYTARIMSLSRARSKFLRQIKQLENNGNNDIFALSSNGSYIYGYIVESINSPIKSTLFPKYQKLLEELPSGRNKYLNIIDLYNKSKKYMSQTVINKNDFEKFLQYVI